MKKFIFLLLFALPQLLTAQVAPLNFENKQDFKDATRGFIATQDEPDILDANGNVVYTLAGWDFLKEECPATANKSLWRESQLNRIHGLFEVVPDKIYQIRGFDLANMTFIKSDTGWIIIDVTTSKETAAAGYNLVKKHLGDLPVRAVIITHPHADHFSGIDAIVEGAPNKDYDIIVPKGFLKHAQEENIMAGVTMARRASYMYGDLLPKNAEGNIGTGLGQTTPIGTTGMPKPTIEIGETGEKLTVDGVDMEFIYAPNAEAPVEIMIYFPQMKAFCVAEEINRTIHNLLTLRGAVVRNGLLWSKHIDTALQLYGDEVEVSFSTHHWPTWGNENIVEYWTAQRDLYRYMHDQTLNLANKGYTPKEIAEEIVLPESLDTLFYCRGYYGTISHNVKAQYQMYFGWYDGNPANLNPLPPVEEGKRYVEAIGGSERVLTIAREAYQKKDYRWCATLLNNLVFAEPENKEGRQLLADTYTQLGYQAESGPWRNFYLSGAYELTHGVNKELSTFVDLNAIAALDNDVFFDKLAAGKEAVINVRFTDTDQKISMILSNGALSHRMNSELPNADLTLSISKTDFVKAVFGLEKFPELLKNGKAAKEGNMEALTTVLTSMDAPDPFFNIVLP